MTRPRLRLNPDCFTPVDPYVLRHSTTSDESIQWAIDTGKIKPPPPRRPQRQAPPPRLRVRR
jgi:hypothetical protein